MFLWGRFLGCVDFLWRCRMCDRLTYRLGVIGALFFSLFFQTVQANDRGRTTPELAKIEILLERSHDHQKIIDRSTVDVDPQSFIEVQIQGLDRWGHELQNFEFDPELMIMGDNPDRIYYAFIERTAENSHHYRIYVDAELNTKFMLRIFDRRYRNLKKDFFVNVDHLLRRIQMYLEDEGYHRYLKDGETISIQPYESIVFEVRGFDSAGGQLDEFDFDPLVTLEGDHQGHDCLTLEKLQGPGLHYRLTADGDSYERVSVVVHDHSRHDLEQRFYVKLSYELQKIQMYLEDEGYRRYLEDGENLSLEPNGNFVFEVQGFDANGRKLSKFEFLPEVQVVGGERSYINLEKLPGYEYRYRLSVDGQVRDKFEVRVHDRKRNALEKRFFVRSHYLLNEIKLYLRDTQGRFEFRRELRDDETLTMQPGESLELEVRGFDEKGNQLDKFAFTPVIRSTSWDHDYATIEELPGYTHRYRLTTCSLHEHDRFELTVRDSVRGDVRRRFYISSTIPYGRINRMQISVDGRRLVDGERLQLREGDAVAFVIEGLDSRGRLLPKDRFAPSVELRNYSGNPRDAYLEMLPGNEHAYRLHYMRASDRGDLEVRVTEIGNQTPSISFSVSPYRPHPPRPANPKITVLDYQNDANATRLQLSGRLEDFVATSGHVETSHDSAHGSIYPVQLRDGRFATDYIELPQGGLTTITIKLVNEYGDEISSVGYARYGNRGYRGFETTEYKRGGD